jgi:hypothetical protein
MTDPFTQPAQGAPYWLRLRDPLYERRHRALIERMEALHRFVHPRE